MICEKCRSCDIDFLAVTGYTYECRKCGNRIKIEKPKN